MEIYSPEDHPDDAEAIRADQRKIYAGPSLYPCPTCGREGAITREMKRRGYHCDDCTREVEFGF